jgi:hypothetical protein
MAPWTKGLSFLLLQLSFRIIEVCQGWTFLWTTYMNIAGGIPLTCGQLSARASFEENTDSEHEQRTLEDTRRNT